MRIYIDGVLFEQSLRVDDDTRAAQEKWAEVGAVPLDYYRKALGLDLQPSILPPPPGSLAAIHANKKNR